MANIPRVYNKDIRTHIVSKKIDTGIYKKCTFLRFFILKKLKVEQVGNDSVNTVWF